MHRGAGIATDLLQAQAVMGFEPDPVMIDDADDGDRNIEPPGRDGSNAVECPVGRGIENVIPLHGGHPGSFIRRDKIHQRAPTSGGAQ